MSKIREIIRLHEISGMSVRMISRALKVSRPAVDHYLTQARKTKTKWADAESMTDEELVQRLQESETRKNDPRYADLVNRLAQITHELGKKHVTRHLLWEEYRRDYPGGYEYSQFCFHIQMFTADSQVSMHLDHEPARRLFVDFAGTRPSLTDAKTGIEQPVELFVSVLPASGLIYTEAVASQQINDLCAGTRHSFEYVGGVPAIIVPDNLKAAVTKPDRYEPDLNRTFEDFGRYYGCVVIPARPAKPRDKALVEAAVNTVYTRILAPLRNRRFTTLEELNNAIWEYLDVLNDRQMKRLLVSRRQRFEQIERAHLAPLPVRPYVTRRFISAVTVQMNYHLYFTVDKHYYSVPYRYRRKKVRVAYTDGSVEIYNNNERIAAHRREPGAHQYTTNPDHMPSQHRFMSEWNPQRFLRWAGEIGTHTRELVEAVLAAREVPEQAYRSCLGILNLEKRYNRERLETACRRACHYRIHTYRGVKNILDKGLDCQELDPSPEVLIPAHENIRGGRYYAPEESRIGV